MVGYAAVVDAAFDADAFVAGMISESLRRAAHLNLKAHGTSAVNEISFRLVHGQGAVASEAERAAAISLDTEAQGDVDFSAYSFSPPFQAPMPLRSEKMPEKMMNMLAGLGHTRCNTLPGPRIEEKMAAIATKSANWWASLRDEGEADMPIFSEFSAANITSTICDTVSALNKQLSRSAWPSWGAIRNMYSFFSVWRGVCAGPTSPWDAIDSNSGLAPTPWIESAMRERPTSPCSLSELMGLVAEPGSIFACIRAAMLQVVRFHTHRDRAGIDLPRSVRDADAAVADFNEWLRPMIVSAMEAIRE
jgi:hypothetical protein